MKYTREQLINAQIKYNKEFIKSPKDFADASEMNDTREYAESQVDYLLFLV